MAVEEKRKSLGGTLRAAREAKGVTLAHAEAITRIRKRYLQALEDEDWGILPDPTYIRGFLRGYARYLGLDPQSVLSLYEEQVRQPKVEPEVRPATRPLAIPGNLIFSLILGILVFLVFAGGLAYMYRQYAASTPPPTPINIPKLPTSTPTPTHTPLSLLEVAVPDLVGRDLATAEQDLRALGLKVEVTDRRFDDRWLPGRVITQTVPAGTRVSYGSTIGVVLSKGRQGVSVPHVVNLTFEQAQSLLANAGLRVERRDTPSDRAQAGIVVRQEPASLTVVAPGSTVVVYVSQGEAVPGKVKVPNVVGKPLDEARKILADAGLQVRSVNLQDFNFVPPGHVLSTTPPAGALVDSGSFIDIGVRRW